MKSNPFRVSPFWTILLFIVSVILGFIQSHFEILLELPLHGAYFYEPKEWSEFMMAVEACGAEDSWLSLKAFMIFDFASILAYSILGYQFYQNIRDQKDVSDHLRFLFLGGLLVMAYTDIIENIAILELEENVPLISGIKYSAGFVALLVLVNVVIRRNAKPIVEILATLWYSRISVLGLILVLAYMIAPQGRDMLIYILESETNERIFYIFSLHILVFFAGIVYWYMPRFFFPENPASGAPSKISWWYYLPWTQHYQTMDRDMGEKSIGRPSRITSEHRLIKEFYKNKRHEAQGEEGDLDMIVMKQVQMARTYVPLFLGILVYILMIDFVASLSANLDNNVSGTEIPALVGQVIFAVAIAMFLFERWRGPFLEKATKLLSNALFFKIARLIWFTVIAIFVILLIAGQTGLDRWGLRLQMVILFGNAVLLLSSTMRHKFDVHEYQRFKERSHRVIILGLMLASLIFILYLIFWTQISLGVAIGFLVVLFYYYAASMLALTGRRKNDNKGSYYFTSFIIVIILSTMISFNTDNNHLDVKLTQLGEDHDRQLTLENYVSQWESNLSEYVGDPSEKIPVFLVAANGGGTLQAYWTAMVISQLRKMSEDRFKNHVFAFSGASGGCVGMGLSTLMWQEPHDTLDHHLNAIYNHDFLSGGLAMLLTSDQWLNILPFNLRGVLNRNSWLLNKYKIATDKVIQNNMWDSTFLNAWKGDLRPLYFANTTLVRDGERAVSSQVPLTELRSSGFDLIAALEQNDQTLTFGRAAFLSNRFPYLNGSGKIGEIGHFVDGGYHDNSGLETLQELYNTLLREPSKYLDTSRYQIQFIKIDFEKSSWRKYGPGPVDTTCTRPNILAEQSELMVPLNTFYKSLLDGQVKNRLEDLIQRGIKVHHIMLPPPTYILERLHDRDEIEVTDEKLADIHLNLITNPLARTVSTNQKNYVKFVLDFKEGFTMRKIDTLLQTFEVFYNQ